MLESQLDGSSYFLPRGQLPLCKSVAKLSKTTDLSGSDNAHVTLPAPEYYKQWLKVVTEGRCHMKGAVIPIESYTARVMGHQYGSFVL